MRILSIVALAAFACARNIRIVGAEAQAAKYACDPATLKCQPAGVIDPEMSNPPRLTMIALPPECGGLVHEILILDAGSSKPEVLVTCAPPSQPIEDMR
jgi:hypothetical protein